MASCCFGISTCVLSVDTALLNFTAVNKVKNFKVPNPRLTFTESGLVLGRSAKKVFKCAPVLSTTATKKSPTGQYPIVVKRGTLQLINKNYTFEFVSGVLQVAGKAPR
jgi:MBG domain (YGX type)